MVLVTAVAIASCCPARAPAPQPITTTTATAAVLPPSDPVSERAEHFLSQAREHEPIVTPMLIAIATESGGEMYKLEYRLKTRQSAERKIRKIASENNVPVADVWIDDALRYTMVVDDDPPGRYAKAVTETLTHLEKKGYAVKRLKNYWPDEDNYSGINSVLESPNKLEWELQFHTQASVAAQARSRPLYEQARLQETLIERQRELFDQMTMIWNEVPIPKGVLDYQALHPKNDIRFRKRP
jgi:hypothetical protein